MNRQRTDIVVGGLVVIVLIVGGALSWDAYQQQQVFAQMGSMMGGSMGSSMGSVHGTDPLWYVLGTLPVSAVSWARQTARRCPGKMTTSRPTHNT
jgi:hypothetical protein